MLYKKEASGTSPSSAIGSCSLVVCVPVGLSGVDEEEVAVGVGRWAVVWNVVTGTI